MSREMLKPEKVKELHGENRASQSTVDPQPGAAWGRSGSFLPLTHLLYFLIYISALFLYVK